MGSIDEGKWTSAAFRVWSATMTPEEMQDRIGLIPTVISRNGEAITTARIIVRKMNFFRIDSDIAKSEQLDRHLERLCDLLEPAASKIATLGLACNVDLLCGFASGNGQGGFTLKPPLLKRIAALNVQLSVDLYPWNDVD